MKPTLYFYLSVIAILFSGNIFSQDNDLIKNDRYLIVKFAPLNLIDPVNPSIQFGFETKLRNRINIQCEIGYIVPISVNPYRDYNPEYSGFKVRCELRYYLSRIKSKQFGYYISPELYYTKNFYKSDEGFNKKGDSINFRSDYHESIRIIKNLIGLNLKIGYQKQIKNIIIDTYVGVGLKYKIIGHYDRSHPEDEITNPRGFYMSDLIAGKLADEKGKYFIVNFPINIKIGYLF